MWSGSLEAGRVPEHRSPSKATRPCSTLNVLLKNRKVACWQRRKAALDRRRSTRDRRSSGDRRKQHDLSYFSGGGIERRSWKERRVQGERRRGLRTAYDTYKEDIKSIAADFYVIKSFDLTELKQKIAIALQAHIPSL